MNYKIGDAVRRNLENGGKGRVSIVCRIDPYQGSVYVNLIDQSDSMSGCMVEDCKPETSPVGSPGFLGKPWTAESLDFAKWQAERMAAQWRKHETRWGRPPQLF